MIYVSEIEVNINSFTPLLPGDKEGSYYITLK